MKSTRREPAALDPHVVSVLQTTVQDLKLSARMYARIVIVARRFAEWTRADKVETRHVLDAIQFCTLGEER